MARGCISSLLRCCSSRHSISWIRAVLISNAKSCEGIITSSNLNCAPNYPSYLSRNAKVNCSFVYSKLYSTLSRNDCRASENVKNDDDIVAESSILESDNENRPGGDNISLKCELFEDIRLRDPVKIYKSLCDVQKGAKQTRADWDVLVEIFRCFAKSGLAINLALAIYIGASFFPTAVHKFRSYFFRKLPADVGKYLVSLGPGHKSNQFLFPVFVEFYLEEFPDEIKRFQSIMASADLTKPHTWFPFARAMKRKVIYHCGPTNSGKTYNALQRFMEAKNGVYCTLLPFTGKKRYESATVVDYAPGELDMKMQYMLVKLHPATVANELTSMAADCSQ